MWHMSGVVTKWRNVFLLTLGPSGVEEALKFRLNDLSLSLSPPTVGPSAVQRLDSSTVRTYSCWEEEERDLKLYAVCNTTQILALSNTQLSSEVLKQMKLDEREEGQLFSQEKHACLMAWRASALFVPGSCDKVKDDDGASSEPPSHTDVSSLKSVQKKTSQSWSKLYKSASRNEESCTLHRD